MSLWNVLFSFRGRIGRADFWLKWALPFYSVAYALVFITWLRREQPGAADFWLALVLMVYAIVGLWPFLAVFVKRWHDRGKSGWWMLILMVPLIGLPWLVIECGFLKGTEGPNRFGADPLGPDAAVGTEGRNQFGSEPHI